MECGTQESEARYTKHLNLYWLKTYICRYRVNQHLIVLNLYSVSINKILVMKFATLKVSRNLNLNLNLVECLEQTIRKQINCKRPSSTKQINTVQNIRIETCK